MTYRMMYHRFGELYTMEDRDLGTDVARGRTIGHKDIHFKYFEEAYSSRNWIVRIYKVLPRTNRAKPFEHIPDRKLTEETHDERIFEGPGTELSGGPTYYTYTPYI